MSCQRSLLYFGREILSVWLSVSELAPHQASASALLHRRRSVGDAHFQISFLSKLALLQLYAPLGLRSVIRSLIVGVVHKLRVLEHKESESTL